MSQMTAYSSDREIEDLEREIFDSLDDGYCWEKHCSYDYDDDPIYDLLPTQEHLDYLAEQAFGSLRLTMRCVSRIIDSAHGDPDGMPPDWDAFD
jgi:hypothetical protein